MLIQPPANPTKELARLDAMRRAKLGKLYGKFWVAPGVRWPSEFNEQGLWEPLPPKKPAESVRFAHEEERLKKAIGAEFDFRAVSNGVTDSPNMAATAPAYRKPPQSTSENSSAALPFSLLKKAKSSALHPRRRSVLVAMLELGNQFATLDSPNQLYMATLTIAVELGLPYITVRRAIDALEQKDHVLKIVYPENVCGPCWDEVEHKHHQFRRTRTYQVDEEKLVPRMSIREHRARRFGEIANNKRKAQHSVSRFPTTAPEPAAPASNPTPQAAAPVPVAPTESAYRVPQAAEHATRFEEVRRGGDGAHRSPQRKFRQLRASDGKAVVAKILQLQKGIDGYKSAEGFWVKYPPGHPEIQPPMSMNDALIKACRELRLPLEPSKDYAEGCGLRFDEPGP